MAGVADADVVERDANAEGAHVVQSIEEGALVPELLLFDDLQNQSRDRHVVRAARFDEEVREIRIALQRRRMDVDGDRRRARNSRTGGDGAREAGAIDFDFLPFAADVFEEHLGRLDVGVLWAARKRFEREEHRLAAGDLEDRLEENRKTARREDVVEQRAALHDAAPIRRCTVAAISGSGVGLARNASAPRARALRWISGAVCAVRMITRVPRE